MNRSTQRSGRRGGWQTADLPPAEDAAAWFTGRLPDGWFTDVEVTVDREEITVVGTLAEPVPAEDAAAEGRMGRFRSETRDQRIEIAQEAEARYGRKVSWGVRYGETEALFTHLAVPVMTRLRQPERRVLDTLVDAGVARSRSDALAWAVRLVGQHAEEWLGQLREAMAEVDKLRADGPAV
jgi:Arc/MetJ-type ribon-helix-helix transcriptional regulator